MNEMFENIKRGNFPGKDELISILSTDAFDIDLFNTADVVREHNVGKDVHLRGLIEFSNYCRKDCLYCGLRKSNKNIKRYRLTPKQIIKLAGKAKSCGYMTVVLQSGEDRGYSLIELCSIIEGVKKFDLALTLSIGEKTRAEYKEYKAAGADRYLLRIETTDADLYKTLHPKMSFSNRMKCLDDLKELGYEVGTGCLVGLPEQTVESLAEDLLFFKSLDADMVGLGPFIPNPDTPLFANKGGTFVQSLKMLALSRVLLPKANIPATSAMESLDKNGRIKALQCGANVIMPNVTEGKYRKLYALYPGKICVNDSPLGCRSCVENKISKIGRSISKDYGFREK
ncbi:MAG: [FeFe] hydrogenase H-cluster radical SAM maturase HydE [Deferribacteraceae bacterium]|jgi:biotin synthase|nr:[FeFe] hydrogenase H-cluster radical SAM maturase HydE [Deferribacteraceae bacterium]